MKHLLKYSTHNYNAMKPLHFLVIALILPFAAYTQVQRNEFACIGVNEHLPVHSANPKDTLWEPTTAIYLELLGKMFYSLNVDFRKRETAAFSIGFQTIENDFLPNLMYYRFLGNKHRLETGGGCSVIIVPQEGIQGIAIHGVFGYRYQKKKGLIFRAGFTPFYGISFTDEGDNIVMPWVGLSLGYSF